MVEEDLVKTIEEFVEDAEDAEDVEFVELVDAFVELEEFGRVVSGFAGLNKESFIFFFS